jgi:hypothetical protein
LEKRRGWEGVGNVQGDVAVVVIVIVLVLERVVVVIIEWMAEGD